MTSPRPWTLRDGKIVDAEGDVVLWVEDLGNECEAPSILRAVNAHGALVAVVKDVEWRGYNTVGAATCPSCDGELHAADCDLVRALRLAEG